MPRDTLVRQSRDFAPAWSQRCSPSRSAEACDASTRVPIPRIPLSKQVRGIRPAPERKTRPGGAFRSCDAAVSLR